MADDTITEEEKCLATGLWIYGLTSHLTRGPHSRIWQKTGRSNLGI